MVLLCWGLVSSASAVYYETWDFVGTPGTDIWTATVSATSLGWGDGYYGGAWQSNIDASGQGVDFDSVDANKWVYNNPGGADGAGDFVATVRLDNIVFNGGYNEVHWAVSDGSWDNTHRVGLKTWEGALYLQSLSWDLAAGGFYGHEAILYEDDGITLFDPTTISSFEIQAGWTDTAGVGGIWSAEFVINAGLADEQTIVAPDVAYLIDASEFRWDYIWAGAWDMEMNLDYYEMAAVPEPATLALLGLGGLLLRRKRA